MANLTNALYVGLYKSTLLQLLYDTQRRKHDFVHRVLARVFFGGRLCPYGRGHACFWLCNNKNLGLFYAGIYIYILNLFIYLFISVSANKTGRFSEASGTAQSSTPAMFKKIEAGVRCIRLIIRFALEHYFGGSKDASSLVQRSRPTRPINTH